MIRGHDMPASKLGMVGINCVGGVAVLGSYAYCLLAYPGEVHDFWGGVPEGLRPIYTTNMFLAAAGYFAFTFYLVFRLMPAPVGSRGVSVGMFNVLYVSILLPSALWMPLTFAMLTSSPSEGLWWIIRLTLAATGIGSLGVLIGLALVRPTVPSVAHTSAVVGSLPFCFQTVILDALVWPVYFPVPG